MFPVWVVGVSFCWSYCPNVIVFLASGGTWRCEHTLFCVEIVKRHLSIFINSFILSVTTSSLTHPLPTSMTSLFLQTHGHLASPMLKLKPLASVLSLTLLQSSRILSPLTAITFSPHAFKIALKTHLYKQYYNNWFQILSSFFPDLPHHLLSSLLHSSLCAPMYLCVCVCDVQWMLCLYIYVYILFRFMCIFVVL